MKHFFTLLTLSFIFQVGLPAQIQVQLGSGANVTGTTTASPVNIYFRSAHSQIVYTAAEMNAAGISAGYISKLGFYVVQASIYSMPSYSIKMKHTSATDAAIYDAGPFEEVYFNASYAPTAGGFDLLALDELFLWNGTDNILIDVCFDIVQPNYNASGTVRYYDVANGYGYAWSDNQNMCSFAANSVHSQKPQLLLEFSAVAPNDASVISVDAPTDFCPGMYDVVATIGNYGTNVINSVTVNWEFDGVVQTPISYNTPLDTAGSGNNTAQIILGAKNFAAGQQYPIKIWTSSPNGVADTVNFNDTLQVVISPGLSGTYTIGGASPDYNTLTEAAAALALWGVCGPVVFNVRNGTYNEQLSLSEITGMDASNTVTFQSESGDSSLVNLTFSASPADNYTVELDGADWFVFKDLTIEATNASYARAVVLQNGASHNRFENCELRGYNTSNTSDGLAVVFSPGNSALDEYNVFQNNHLRNGSFGFYWLGINDLSLEQGNAMDNNRVENAYYMGIYTYYQDAILVRGNDISTNSAYSSPRGIYAGYCDNNSRFLRNKIRGVSYGLQFDYCDGTGGEKVLVANNFVQTMGANTGYGIYSYYGAFQLVAHNSVQAHNTSAGSSAFYTYQGTNKTLLNNIFANYGGGYAIYRSSANGISQSDYNDLYASGPYLGNWDGDWPTLASWQNASSLDAHSLSLDPLFFSPDDFPVAQVSLNAAAVPVAEVTDDIDGDARDGSTPDIGADEFAPPSLDAGVVELVLPEVPFAPGAQPVAARIKNFGATTLASVDIEWAHNGGAQTPVNWTGSLVSGDTAEVSLGMLSLPANQAHEIRAWTANPNGMADPVALNDTSSVSGVYVGLSGTYTIGGLTPDFADFAEAVDNLNQGGVVGAVTFDVRDGTYNEQVTLREILGASEANTITFQSEAGDSSLVTLAFSANFSDNYTMLLDGADWIRLKKMTLEATNNSYGRVLELRNGASHNEFENCKFRGRPVSSTSGNYLVIYSDANSQLDEYNVFKNNTILNGSYGLFLLGISTGSLERGLVIEGNQIDSSYYRGIYLTYMDAPQIIGNRLATATTHTGAFGLEMYYCSNGTEVSKNKISGFQNIGIYLGEFYASASNPALISNNFIDISGTSTSYGIYSYYGSYQKIYHNSVSISSTASSTYAFYNIWGNDKELLNNIFSNTGGGYALYTNNTSTIARSDHNDLYATGANLGYWNGNRADLAAWTAASTLDSNSVSVDPLFVSPTDLHITNGALDKQGLGVPEVDDDIDGEARDPAIPDIGADEIITDALDAGLYSIESPAVPFPSGTQDVWVRFINNGATTLASVDIGWEVNGAGQATYNWTGSLPAGQASDSINIGSFNFLASTIYTIRAWTSSPNAGTDEEPANDTITVSNLYPALAGVYTVGGTSPDFLDFTEAADALTTGGVAGAVTFNVRNGTYNEQLSLPAITGMGAANTVTFQSEAGDSSLVTLTYSSPSSDNYTLLLDGADWFVFKNLTLEATNVSYGRAVVLQNAANYNRFENCELRGYNATSTSTNHAVVYSFDNNVLDEYNAFDNCLIRQGSYGFYLLGNSTGSRESGNEIVNCRVENAYYQGIYAQYQEVITINGNQVLTNSAYSDSRGISLNYAYNNSQLTKNHVTGFNWGIFLSNSYGTPGEQILATNNFVQTDGTSQQHSIYSSSGAYQRFYHNTARQLNANPSAAAFYASGGSNNVALNNIFANEGGGYAVYRNSANDLSQSDYNNLYVSGPYMGYVNGGLETLADWQAATSHDGNSFGLNPFFLSADGYTVAQVSLNSNATPLGSVTEDIEGDARDAQNPDIGCDEFTPPATDAGIAAILPPAVPFANGMHPVSADLKNYGAGDLTSATINWTVNGVAQMPVNWTGAITSGDAENVALGMVDFAIKQEYEIAAWPSLPNGMADPVALNDTAAVGGIYAGLIGPYTIGGASPDFSTFAEAATNLNLGGVTGAVTFNVRDGNYNEQLVLGEILGADMASTVTFQSESGDSSLAVLTFNSNSAANYTVLLDGADWIRFQNLTLEATNTTYGTVLDLMNGATQNRFENCEFRGVNSNSTSTTRSVIFSSAGQDHDNAFVNNAVLNGSYSFYMIGGNTANLETGLVIENNRIENAYYRGIFLQYMNQLLIRSNRISTVSAYSSGLALYLDYGYDGVEISSNRITGFQNFGIYLINCYASAASPMLIANNFVQTYGTSTGYGIYTNSGSYQKIYHNSVHVMNTNASSYAFYIYLGNNKDVRNNIFANSGGGYAFYRNAFNGLSFSDYNGLYTSGPNIGYWDGDQPTLADWQMASGLDLNSISENPFFVEADSFAVAQVSLNGAATPLPEVPMDIEGEARDATNPDIGCDEFQPPADDAGIALLLPPATPFAAGQHTARAVLKNFGADTLQSVTLNWAVNSSLQTPVAWTGNLPSGDTLVVDLGLVDFSINQAYDIAAWTSLPNGAADLVAINDSSSVENIYAGLAGPYTVGGTSPDFNTFGEAATNLNLGGVVGAVVFNVRDGTYNEQLYLTEAPGADTLQTITFQSESGDSSLVVLTFNANFAANYTCMLDGADWIRFKNMTLEATNFSYGIVLDYRNSANNNRFENCEFRGINSSSTSSNIAVIFSPDNNVLDENNVFLNNYVRDGSIGFYLIGNSTSDREAGLRLENNHIENPYYWGIYMAYAEAPALYANTFATNSAYFSSIGIYIDACYNGVEIAKNRVFGFTQRGIFLNNGNATVADPMLIANNFVQLAGTGSGQGIYTDDGAYQKFYHNTVHCINTNTGSSAFYTYRGNNKDVLNNIFANTGGGYAIYRSSTNGLIRCDYNDLYVTGANLGNWNGDQADLVAWTAASTLDSNSVSLDPIFVGGTDLHVTNVALDKAGTPVPEVTDDIDGDPRNPANPDIGADEFITAQNDAAVVSIDSPSMPFAADIQPVYVSILNNGLDTLTSVTIGWEVNGILQPPFNWADTLLSAETRDSVCIGTFLFEIDTAYSITAWTSDPNGMLDEDALNDTATVENLYAALGGIYTIGGTDPDFPDFASAVNAMINGGVIDEVTFNVRDGIYAEQVSIPEIMGASVANTITFQSESGDSTAVTLTYNTATNANNYTLKLDGADWMRFEKMRLENTSPTYTRVVDIRNGAANNRFANNEVVGANISSTSANYVLIYSGGSQDDDNTFVHNRLIDGSYGFYYLGANTSNLETGTWIEGNTFENQYYSGAHLYYQDAPVVKKNDIATSGSYFSYDGIYCQYCDNGLQIVNNTVVQSSGDGGIAIENSDGASDNRGLIANNFVAISGTSTTQGIYLSNTTYQNIYHNNVNITSTPTTSRVLFLSGGSNINIVNNVLVNSSSGYVIYNQSTNNISESDFNALYTVGVNFAYWGGGNVANLPEWRTLTGQDANSIDADPLYESATDLHVNEVGLNNTATPLAEVTDDIDGEARNPLTPDIGADEFAPISNNDAGIVEITHPNKITPFAAGLQPVDMVIRNNGSDTLTSAAINWFVNGSTQVPYNWTGFLEPGERDTVSVGDFDFALKFGYDILAFTSMPNGMTDSLAFNDSTLVTELYAGLDGAYTVGGVFPDFTSFSEAANVLNRGGILGAVELNVRNGTYNDQISLGQIRGSGPANTITFQSESGDSSLVTLANNNSLPDYTVQLDGTDYVTFRNMTLQAGLFSYSTVVELGNGVQHFSLLNSRVIAPDFANDDLIESAGSSLDHNLVFQNNAFKGGRYAIELNGQNTGSLESGILVEGNTFESQRDGAVSMIYMDAPEIRSNVISGAGSGTAYYGMLLQYCDNGMEVSGNKITHSGNYGMYFSYCDATSGTRGLTANNFIHLEGDAATQGIYLHSCNFQNIYYNNIHAAGTNAGSRAFNAIYGANNNLLNNVLANSGGGYAIYSSSSGALASSNHNDLYSTGAWLGNWLGSNAADLASWRSLSGRDNNSVSANPLFFSETDLHVLQVALDSAATTIPGLTDDIDGDIRQPNHPDIGADEFDYLEDDVGVVALVAPADDCGLGSAEAVKVAIQNFGGLPQSGFDVAYSFNGGALNVENVGGLAVQPGDTAHYTFSTTVDVSSYTTYSFDAETQLANDQNPGNDLFSGTVENFQTPVPVANMLPADGSTGLPRSILFSWSPSAGAIRYDLYIWPDGGAPPASPTLSDITQINYFFNGNNFFAYGQAYDWQVVAKNNHCETAGPIQGFAIQELPDLIVDSIQVPASTFSGQVMDLTWVVKNMGSGSTGMGQWRDYVFLSDDLLLDLNTDIYLGYVSNFSALAAGESYSNTQPFTLPNGLSGVYYIFVWTDRYNYITEADNDNNTGASTSFTVNLTPPPDLQVTSIIPPGNAFSGSPVNVTWTVTNEGTGETRSGSWWDRVYLSADSVFNQNNATFLGHKRFDGMLAVDSSYTQDIAGTLPQGISGNYFIYVITDYFNYEYEHANELNNTTRSTGINVVLTPPPDLVVTEVVIPTSASNRETVAVQWTVENQGGSATNEYWVDYVFLSDDPNVADLNNAIFLASNARPNNLGPLDTYTASRNVNIPDNITGPYYFYVHTDRNDNVFEYLLNDNNVTRSAGTTLVQTPDLAVANVAAPAGAMSGNAITVSWTVKNDGAGKIQNRSWQDRVYISSSSTYDPGLATQVGALNANVALLPGDSLNRQMDVVLPNGISGQYYVFVRVDGGNVIYENGLEANNVNEPGEPLAITLSPYVDLAPTAINAPAAGTAGQVVSAGFTVKNMGTADAQGLSWKDKVYLLNTSVWNAASAQLLRTEQVDLALEVDSSYTVNTMVSLPVNLPTGTYYLFIVTDQEDDVYEYTQENNNRLASSGIFVTGYPPVDLAVTAAMSTNSVASGQNIQVLWTVENQAAASTIAAYWYDAIYLSTDTILDESVDQLLGTRQQNGPLPGGTSYSVGQGVAIPNGLSGAFYLIVKTDQNGLNNDDDLSNNFKVVTDTAGSNQVVTVDLTPPPDLVVPSFSTPAQGTSGQPIQVVWTVQNNGTGSTASGSWSDRIYLSTDLTLDNGDLAIATVSHSGNLMPGASYTDTVLANIPISVSGNRIVIIKTDYNNTVFEHTAEGNNTASAAIFIIQPPPTDLVVTNVIVPTAAIAGEEVMVEWTLENIGANPAEGSMAEAVYFSTDDVWDVGDPLLGVQNGNINLGPSAVANRSLMADLTGVSVGSYYAIVRTDILNNIYESNDNNNTAVSDMQVSVNVAELPIGVLTPDILADNMELYYRIEVPEALTGESLLVTLKGDSVAGANELYLRYGNVPTRVAYDYGYDIPFFGNQEVVIPELQAGTYYLLAYGATANGDEQDITLLAEILNFEIRHVNAGEGGNTGEVTLEVNGSKFDSTMALRLEDGLAFIPAVHVFYVDPTRVYATFNLAGRPQGLYDVTAEKTNAETATLADGFEVIGGLPADLATNIVQPSNARPNRTVSMKVEYANNGNVDIPNPVITLQSLAGAPVSLTVAGLDDNLTALDLPLDELGGPPGVLRPGASGSITVYVKSTAALGFLLVIPGF